MRSKIILLTLMLVGMVLTASAFEKASDKDVKQAKNIFLEGRAFNSGNTKDYEDEVFINLIDFRTAKWYLAMITDDGACLSGFFNLTAAYKSDGITFMGTGINNETGQEVDFYLSSDNDSIYLRFNSSDEEEKINLPYDCFSIHKLELDDDDSDTAILFNDIRMCFDFDDPGWKSGTTKQLKKCLSENPYLRKL